MLEENVEVQEQLSIADQLNSMSFDDDKTEGTEVPSPTQELETAPKEDTVESINEEKSPLDDLDKIDPEEFDFDADDQEDPIKPVEATEDAGEKKTDEEILAEYKDITAEELAKDPLLADKIRGAFMATSRGKKIFESYRTLRDLEKAPEEGGLGFRPDKDSIVRNHQLAAGHENLLRDLEELSDSDEVADNVLTFLTSGTDRIKNESSAVLVQKLPYFLARNRPELLVGLETQILEANARRFEQMAKTQTNQKYAKYYTNLAKAIKHELGSNGGTPVMPVTSADGTTQGNNLPPEVARELEELRREKQNWSKERVQANDERLNSYYNEFMEEANGVVSGLFEKMFTVLKEPNGVLKPYRDRVVSDTVSKVLSNENFRSRLERSIDDAFKSGSVQQRNQALQDLRRNVIPYVRQVASSVREDLKSMRPTRQNPAEKAEADRTKLTQQADNKAPDGGGVAAPSGTSSGIEQYDPTKETYQQYLNRQLA